MVPFFFFEVLLRLWTISLRPEWCLSIVRWLVASFLFVQQSVCSVRAGGTARQSARMEAALASITQELSLCRDLLRAQRASEVGPPVIMYWYCSLCHYSSRFYHTFKVRRYPWRRTEWYVRKRRWIRPALTDALWSWKYYRCPWTSVLSQFKHSTYEH